MAKSTWVCYLVECSDGSLYAGITNNLSGRLAAHNQGTASRYTRNRRPVTVVYTEACANRSEASSRELVIKRMTRLQKLELCNGTEPSAAG